MSVESSADTSIPKRLVLKRALVPTPSTLPEFSGGDVPCCISGGPATVSTLNPLELKFSDRIAKFSESVRNKRSPARFTANPITELLNLALAAMPLTYPGEKRRPANVVTAPVSTATLRIVHVSETYNIRSSGDKHIVSGTAKPAAVPTPSGAFWLEATLPASVDTIPELMSILRISLFPESSTYTTVNGSNLFPTIIMGCLNVATRSAPF